MLYFCNNHNKFSISENKLKLGLRLITRLSDSADDENSINLDLTVSITSVKIVHTRDKNNQ